MPDTNCLQLANFIAHNCIFSHLNGCVLINCHSQKDYIFLIQQRKNIQEAINFIVSTNFFCVEEVTIGIAGTDTRQSFSIRESASMAKIIIPSTNVIQECLSYEGACGIIRMSDNKGLFSNEKIALSSNAHPNDWVGRNMADYWIKDELNKYLTRLSHEGELRNYSYVAKMMSGENARLTVNARIIEWRGEPARIVKTISREILT